MKNRKLGYSPDIKCPICGSELEFIQSDNFMVVMDGNTCYQCSDNITHKFWSHPFDRYHINYNPTVSQIKCDWYRKWSIGKINGEYIEVTKEAKQFELKEREEYSKQKSKDDSKFRICNAPINKDCVDVQPLSEPLDIVFYIKPVFRK